MLQRVQTPSLNWWNRHGDHVLGSSRGLQFYDGEAHSKQLRKYGDIPSGRYHFNKLLDQDVIEKVGEQHVGRGGAASVYRLTDLGEELADELGTGSGGGNSLAIG